MADIGKLKVGDAILYHDGKSFVSKGISLFMREYAKQIYYEGQHIYSHVGTVIFDDGELKIAEAEGRGYQILPIEQAYTPEEWENNIDIYTWVIPYTSSEQYCISNFCKNFSFKITRYEYLNFLWQIAKIVSRGEWIGKPVISRVYCSQAFAIAAQSIRNTFALPDAVNPMDVAVSLDLSMVQ